MLFQGYRCRSIRAGSFEYPPLFYRRDFKHSTDSIPSSFITLPSDKIATDINFNIESPELIEDFVNSIFFTGSEFRVEYSECSFKFLWRHDRASFTSQGSTHSAPGFSRHSWA